MPQITLDATMDTYLASDTPESSKGYATTFYVGFIAPNAARRALLKFDLSELPAGAAVTDAELVLYTQTPATGGYNCTMNVLMWTDWEDEFARWTYRSEDSPWNTPGGDYYELYQKPFNLPTTTGPFSIDVAALINNVRSWGRTTLDLILRRVYEGAGDGQARFLAREYDPHAVQLAVTYSVPASASTAPAVGRSRINGHRRRLRIGSTQRS